MSAGTKIEWATDTFSPWIGCAHVSEGCRFCYAEVNTFTRAQRGQGRELWGAQGARHVVSDAKWAEVLRWNRDASAGGEQRRVFPSMCDWLENRDDLVAPRRRFVDLIEQTTALTWLLLTKRPENAPELIPQHWLRGYWPRHVWFGFSSEDQPNFDERWAHAATIPGPPVFFCSYEPGLGPIDFHRGDAQAMARCVQTGRTMGSLGWVIVGGESGRAARPFDVAWARSTVRQCRRAGVPVFVKQMGGNVRDRNDRLATDRPSPYPEMWPEPECGWDDGPRGNYEEIDTGYQGAPIRIHLRDRKGGDPAEWPEDLRVREFPRVAA